MLDFPELDGPLRRMTRRRAADAVSAASTATSKRISAIPAGRRAGTQMPNYHL
jgi:hypothetical protein